MAEGPTRRACNRCHAQKLSCKRNGEEPCERCLRLKTECKSSLSLRFRRNRLSLGSPRRDDKTANGRQTDGQPGCSSSGFGRSSLVSRVQRDSWADQGTQAPVERGQRGDFGQEQQHSSSAPALVTFGGPEAVLDTVGFPYSSLQGHMFSSEPSPAATLPAHTVPRGISDQDICSLDTAWNPSVQVSGISADWSHPSSSSSYDSSPSNYRYTSSSSFSCLDPQQLRFNEQTEPLDADRGQTEQAQRRLPRRILLRRSSINRMATQGEWLAQLSDINSTLWSLSSLVPYLVESGEDVDVYACETKDGMDSEEEGFPIQSMFEASGRLVQVLEEITQTEGADVRQAELDPGTGLLVLSTYVRLLDLYQKVFQLVHSEVAVSSPCSTFRLCKLPDVSIGSFPIASALSLQMALTMRLAEDFLSNLRAAMALFSRRLPDFATRGQQGGGQASLWSVVDVSFTAIREREQDVSRDLVEIRNKLEMSSTS